MPDWLTTNSEFGFEQTFLWYLKNNIRVSAGYRYLRKTLTRGYDFGGGYTGSHNSTGPDDNRAVYYSKPEADGDDTKYRNIQSDELGNFDVGDAGVAQMQSDNLVLTSDIGGFTEATLTHDKWQLNAGLRYDINSNPLGAPEDPKDLSSHRGYKKLSPRMGLIYSLNDDTSFKLVYGEAVQEPAPVYLFGTWAGRQSAPDLVQEHASTVELIALHGSGQMYHDLAVFFSYYRQVHVAPPANSGDRRSYGVEYKGRFSLENPLPARAPVHAYLNASYTQSKSRNRYDFTDDAENRWPKVANGGSVDVGDYAPVKVRAGLNIPLTDAFHVNLRGRYIGKRRPYLANALRNRAREDGGKSDYLHAYMVADMYMAYDFGFATLGLAVNNMLDADYNHPGSGKARGSDGWEQNADGSMNTKVRAAGYRSSFIPQPLRSVMATLKLDI